MSADRRAGCAMLGKAWASFAVRILAKDKIRPVPDKGCGASLGTTQ